MLRKWMNLPESLRWALFLPAVAVITIICTSLFFLIVVSPLKPEEGTILWNGLTLAGSVISVGVLFWTSINLPPRFGRGIGWLVFVGLSGYVLLSWYGLTKGETVFGNEIQSSTTSFWAVQNLI